jgi:hypothetical protein
MNFNWRMIFIVLAGILGVILIGSFTDWDPIKIAGVAILALAIACWPANA